MSKPMFFFAAVYDDVADADGDHEAIRPLRAGDAIAAMEQSAQAG